MLDLLTLGEHHALADQVRSLIGSDGKRLIFLHSNGWVSSAKARVAETDRYNRHSFIPANWLTTNVTMMTEVTPNGDIIFVKRDEVAVIKRGLENIERETRLNPLNLGDRSTQNGMASLKATNAMKRGGVVNHGPLDVPHPGR